VIGGRDNIIRGRVFWCDRYGPCCVREKAEEGHSAPFRRAVVHDSLSHLQSVASPHLERRDHGLALLREILTRAHLSSLACLIPTRPGPIEILNHGQAALIMRLQPLPCEDTTGLCSVMNSDVKNG
jgi:hypothetical protein